MEAIKTRYIGPTNYRGSRVAATTCGDRPSNGRPDRLVMSWRDDLGSMENHAAAAQALAKRLDWRGSWVAGCTSDGYVFVNAGRGDASFTVEPRE